MIGPTLNKSFSMRRSKTHYERLYKVAMWLYSGHAWINANIRYQTDIPPKLGTCVFLLLVYWFPGWIWSIAMWPVCLYLVFKALWEGIKLSFQKWSSFRQGIKTPPPPLVLYYLKLSRLDSTSLDELAEEFDSFPTSESDVNVLKMRYDRMRKMGEKVMVLMGDLASQGERLYALWTLCHDNPFNKMCFYIASFVIVLIVYHCTFIVFALLVYYWRRFPWTLNDLPDAPMNYFRRLPTNEHLML